MKSINPDNFKVVVLLLQKIQRTYLMGSEDDKENKLDKFKKKLKWLQDVMYAHNRYGVLICLEWTHQVE
jgi:hypothetical protein